MDIRKWQGLVTAVLLAVAAWVPAGARAADELTAEAGVDVLSQYIWRGYELSKDSVVVQPSATIGYNGFSVGVWENIDTDPYLPGMENLNETDWTLSYSASYSGVDVEVGYIWYAISDADDSQEVYLSLGLDTLLNPTLTVYREFYHAPSTYITLGISHTVEMGWRGASLELSLQGSYLASNDAGVYADPDDPGDEYNNFHDGLATATLSIPLNKIVTVAPTVSWSFPLCNDAADDMKAGNADHGGKDNFVYGGISLSFAF